jgi:hypothetical protein
VQLTVKNIGFFAGVIAFTSTIAFVIVQLLQIVGILSFPIDEILIYGTSLCIVIPFVLEMLALHYITPNRKKFWTHASLIFSVLYAVFVTANYVVQLATVIPAKLSGVVSEIAILEQRPKSLFWDFDALGYMFMGIAMLVALPAFERKGVQRWVRISFLANALITPLVGFVYFYPAFSTNLLFLGFPWAITAPSAMLMLAMMFKKNSKASYTYEK